jgi:hypothetical protein
MPRGYGYQGSITCPLRQRKGRCFHQFWEETRYEVYQWSYPKKGNNYLQYVKVIERCELKRQIVSIKIYQFDEINRQSSFYKRQINA